MTIIAGIRAMGCSKVLYMATGSQSGAGIAMAIGGAVGWTGTPRRSGIRDTGCRTGYILNGTMTVGGGTGQCD